MNNPDHDWKWKYYRVCRRCGALANGDHLPPCTGGGAHVALKLIRDNGKMLPEVEDAREKLAA